MENKFYGAVNHTSNKHFTYNPILDEDNIIIRTNNIRRFKDSLVLVVGNNKVVYLKDWQVRQVIFKLNRDWLKTFVVKINRNYFKMYSWKSDFTDFYFEKDNDFDSWKEIASSQTEGTISEVGLKQMLTFHEIEPLRWA